MITRGARRNTVPKCVDLVDLTEVPCAVVEIDSATTSENESIVSVEIPKLSGSSLKDDLDQVNSRTLRSMSLYKDTLKPFITDKVYECLSEFTNVEDVPTVQLPQPTALTNCTLRNYQLEGFSWLVHQYHRRINCILGDEMGLGKTIQTIAMISHLLQSEKLSGQVLVVCPLSVLFNWMSELKRFCPTLDVLRVHSTDPTEQETIRSALGKTIHRQGYPEESQSPAHQVIITTYEMLKAKNISMILLNRRWRAVVLDEGHRIRNDETLLAQACHRLRAVYKLILTGTPVQNNLRETGALLQFLQPQVFQELQYFENAFRLQSDRSWKRRTHTAGQETQHGLVINRALLDRAHYLLRIFMLRRVKSEVENTIPGKIETLLECPLTGLQRDLTQFLLFRQRKLVQQLIALTGGDRTESDQEERLKVEARPLQGLVAHLRKAANHPFLFPGIEEVTLPDGSADENIIFESGKMRVMDQLLQKLLARGHRVVIFSQMTSVLDIIGDYLDLRRWPFYRLDGGTNRVMREVLIQQFNRPASDVRIFCLSTRAGGEGVNLTSADTVILFDSDWNPQVDIQAMARVHRIGQTKVVHVYRLVSKQSVDECVVYRAQKKLFLHSAVSRVSTRHGLQLDAELQQLQLQQQNLQPASESDETENRPESAADEISTSTLLSTIKFGWNSAFSMPETDDDGQLAGLLTDAEINAIIDRTRGLTSSSTSSSTSTDDHTSSPSCSATAESSSVPKLCCVNLKEDQQLSIAQFDERAPLVKIDDLRMQNLLEMERRKRDMRELDESAGDPDDPLLLGRRARKSRMTRVRVKNVGEVNVLTDQLQPAPARAWRSIGKDILKGFTRRSKTNIVEVMRSQSLETTAISAGAGQACPTSPDLDLSTTKREKKRFTNQDLCQICWDGGEILLCPMCPVAVHPDCARRFGRSRLPPTHQMWSCSHHLCWSCDKSASQVGMLFRCEVCPTAYCEDCLPGKNQATTGSSGEASGTSSEGEEEGYVPQITIDCARFEALGFHTPSSACYFRCSKTCAAFDDLAYLEDYLRETEETSAPTASVENTKKKRKKTEKKTKKHQQLKKLKTV